MRPSQRPASLLALLALAHGAATTSFSPDPVCVAQAEALCLADAHCAAFGLMGDNIQLHGCAVTVPNSDWTIFVRAGASFSPLPGPTNVNESACPTHPSSGMQHTCRPGPPGPPPTDLYTRLGSVDVGTFENTLVYWQGRVLNVENIGCSYVEHAGIWEPAVFGNHSYARIRDFETGVVLVNITKTVGFGFVTAFPDYDRGVLHLFGTPADRCNGTYKNADVWTWWSEDGFATFNSAVAISLPEGTYNTGVTLVGPLSGSGEDGPTWRARHDRVRADAGAAPLPSHNFAMMLECFHFAVNEGDNVSTGWTLLPNTTSPPGGECGGPTMHYNPTDTHYYVLTGGKTVTLHRTLDFVAWEESAPTPFLFPDEGDAQVAPFMNFVGEASTIKGSPGNIHVGVPAPYPSRPFVPYWEGANWTAWVQNNNDADVCCHHANVSNMSYVIWGSSTQGGPPSPPLTGRGASTNAVGTARMPLWDLLPAYFPPPASAASASTRRG